MKYVYKMVSILALSLFLLVPDSVKAYSYHWYSWEIFEMVERNDIYAVESWLRSYPNVNIRNHFGQTPFMIAIKLQHYTIANRLLAAGADRYLRDDYGRTARDYAYDASISYQLTAPPSSDAHAIWAALGIGAVAGLAAYAFSDNPSSWSVSYNSGDSSSYCNQYCPGCGATLYADESFYCRGCCR